MGWTKPIPLACEKRQRAEVQLEPFRRWMLTIADAQLEDSGSNWIYFYIWWQDDMKHCE